MDPDDTSWYTFLSFKRAAAALRYRQLRDRSRCIGAGLLLSYALKIHAPRHPLPPRTVPGVNGKPCLPELPGFHFNISHSGDWVVCAVGASPLGVDIERVQRDISAVAQKYYSSSELQHLLSLPLERQAAGLVEIWVLKESYMKATGLGLHLPLHEIEVHWQPEIHIYRAGSPVPFGTGLCSFNDRDYRLGLAVYNQASPPPCRVEPLELEPIVRCLSLQRNE